MCSKPALSFSRRYLPACARDLPGQVTAQVTEDVYDSPTGRTRLTPQGARLIGQYDAQIAFGQTRALLVWTRQIMPNGRSIVLERQPGADAEGYAGLEDEVDNHWGTLSKAAILSTLLSIGSEVGSSGSEDDPIRAIRRGGADSVNQIGQRIVGCSLNVQPTVTIRPGFPVRVLVAITTPRVCRSVIGPPRSTVAVKR